MSDLLFLRISFVAPNIMSGIEPDEAVLRQRNVAYNRHSAYLMAIKYILPPLQKKKKAGRHLRRIKKSETSDTII